ncbi:hypothetical protein C8Q73DRAFT_689914 [Cubamyces lactineus]|nr:hypothetical protein C8Q73DRAFT_689914 [Cubamyces lactineus]
MRWLGRPSFESMVKSSISTRLRSFAGTDEVFNHPTFTTMYLAATDMVCHHASGLVLLQRGASLSRGPRRQ